MVVVVVVEVVAILNFGLALSAAETAWANSIPRTRKKSDLVIENVRIVDSKIIRKRGSMSSHSCATNYV